MSEKVTAPFRMLRAVCDDAETAALAAASEHLHQLDKLRLEVTALTQENGELALEAARLRKQHEGDSAAAAELFQTTQRLRSEREAVVAELNRLADQLATNTARMNDAIGQREAAQLEAREAVAELAHVREQLASTLATIEKATTEAANAVVYANVDTSLRDPREGKLLVVRLDSNDADRMRHGYGLFVFPKQFVGWLEAAQDEGDTETKAVDVHHEGLPTPVASADCPRGGCATQGFHAADECTTDLGPCFSIAELTGGNSGIVSKHHEGDQGIPANATLVAVSGQGPMLPSVDDKPLWKVGAPVVRCGECTSVNGHFGDCAKAVQP